MWELEGAVAGLSIDAAEFFLAEESPNTAREAQIPPDSPRSELNYSSMTLLACMGRRWPQERSTVVPSRNIIIRQPDRDRSNECCKAPSSIHRAHVADWEVPGLVPCSFPASSLTAVIPGHGTDDVVLLFKFLFVLALSIAILGAFGWSSSEAAASFSCEFRCYPETTGQTRVNVVSLSSMT